MGCAGGDLELDDRIKIYKTNTNMKYELFTNNHPKFTDDEKELMGLIREAKDFYKHINLSEKNLKEIIKEKLKELDYYEEGINSFEDRRKEFQRKMDDREKPLREEVHHVNCPKCKKHFDQKARSEE